MGRRRGQKDTQKRKPYLIKEFVQMMSLNEAYARLGVAIVEQACKDAMGYYNNGYGDTWEKEMKREFQIAEVKRFFCSGKSIFDLCMPNTDGPSFYKKIMENWRKYNYYIPPDISEKGGKIIL